MNKFILAIFGLSFALLGCKKSVQIQGRVYNAMTGIGMKNVDLVFKSNVSAKNPLGTESKVTTDAEGKFIFDQSLSANRAHQLEIMGMDFNNYYFLSTTERSILNGKFDEEFDFPFIPLKTVVLFVSDTTKAMASELKSNMIVNHKVASNYYPSSAFELLSQSDGSGTTQMTSSIKMPQGWNYISGKSMRSDGSVYVFIDSFLVEFNNTNQIWDLKY
ncbi:MAG: carboxypeptidase-like regulatory domain-containing protein [Bacteroidetes bacterium]|nr:carboxypeptidase-like regulatory domain-containing protein [Bacteroidota bacterium]